MKKFIIIFLLISNTLFAEKIEQLSWFNLQELLEDDNLTYKIIKSCVSLNSAVTEIISEEHPELGKKFFETAVEKQKKSNAVEEIKQLSEQILSEIK